VVANFGVKYINNNNIKHLITSLENWTGDQYCSIALDWDYVNRTVDIYMPGYIKKKIQEYGHLFPNRTQRCPYSPEPKKFGFKAQAPLPHKGY
jgi:hypothetical protein